MSLVPLETFDQNRADAFASRMIDVLNQGAVALLCSIGHRTRLFDVMEALPPSTSQEIARAASLEERYVREWLGGMVLGRVIDYEPQARKYSLSAEHAASLTRAAGTDNLAFFTQYLPLLASVEDGIVDCFVNGGGLPYAAYPRFQEVQAEESARTFDETLIQRTLPLDPALVEKLERGIDVADVGCGQGHAINLMARKFPASRFTGYDFSQEGIAGARAEAREWGLTNVRFEVADVATLDAIRSFDLVTAFDSIHDQVAPREVLSRIARSLRPGGVFLMVDIAAATALEQNYDHPFGPLLFALSSMHCMTVSLSAGGEGLGTAWGEEKALELLSEAGFRNVEAMSVEGDVLNTYFFARLD